VPLIHIASTACYVDLFGNIGASIAILMTYLLYIKKDFLNPRNIIIFTIGAGIAANTKYLMVPPVFIIFIFALIRIILLYFPQWQTQSSLKKTQQISCFLGLTLFIGILIFATEFKNIVLYQNPFYPMKIEIAGITLNHLVEPSSNYMSEQIQGMSPLTRWIFSLLEIGAFDKQRPWLWTIAMDYVPLNSNSFGMGGYFAIYVVFNLLLFAFLCTHWNQETKTALIMMIVMSLITIFLPFSYQLRYYMYWIITLIIINLYLVGKEQNSEKKLAFVNWNNVGYFCLAIVISFGVITRWDYTYPNAMSLQKFMSEHNRVEQKIINQIKDGEKVCIVSSHPVIFLYSSKFHQGRDYSLKYEFPISDDFVRDKCSDYRIINYVYGE
jgi:hypothetical protein